MAKVQSRGFVISWAFSLGYLYIKLMDNLMQHFHSIRQQIRKRLRPMPEDEFQGA